MADKIQLEGMVFYGFHGVGPEELWFKPSTDSAAVNTAG